LYRSKFQHFFSILFGNSYRIWRLTDARQAFIRANFVLSERFPTKLTQRLLSSFCGMNDDKKMVRDFFRVIFLFKKLSGHFFFTKWINLLGALYSFYLTRFY